MVFTNALELLVIMKVIASFCMGLSVRWALGFWLVAGVCSGVILMVVSCPPYCAFNCVLMVKRVARAAMMFLGMAIMVAIYYFLGYVFVDRG